MNCNLFDLVFCLFFKRLNECYKVTIFFKYISKKFYFLPRAYAHTRVRVYINIFCNFCNLIYIYMIYKDFKVTKKVTFRLQSYKKALNLRAYS